MSILDRYILKKFLSSFVFVVLVLIIIVCIIDFTEKNDDFMRNNLSAVEILGYYKNFIPWIVNLITPITVFIATVFVTAKLAGHTEIIAILSSGVSFHRLMVPYLIGASIIASFSFYMTGWVIPSASKEKVAFEQKYIKSPFYFNDRDIHLKVAPNTYLYMQSYNNRSNVGYKPTLENIEGNELKARLSASRIEWQKDSANWLLKNWELREFHGLEETVKKGQQMDTTLQLSPADFQNQAHKNETLTIPQLDEYMALLKNRGADNVEEFYIEKLVRYMSPFAAIVLTFIGLIVSSRKQRGGAGLQIAQGFVIAFAFILFFIMSRAIAEASDSMPPLLGVWLPNIIFSCLGLVMYRNVPK
ncbi:LptF/LptG family permease [Xanthovirga aplysinae]|uniref:LptF/LptG family permease n=1 Tax=Xanthovirga aplysinae TaxID=2529853 RepID=UPI0012BCC23D|nr:LptF/LptG family permease [Xanthovirga aplysinae]MTI31590.1 YjgP/YjgQ family permease [Xanthovirga aplysinae]